MNKSLFECVIKNDEYEEYLDDISRLCALIVVYYILHSGEEGFYIFNLENSFILFIGYSIYHLIFRKILRIKCI
tara:strand:+ start:126 stop:347 length:222 start_codon:yes stop_codon:yes gene_type:complete